jgi:hypothetical protein
MFLVGKRVRRQCFLFRRRACPHNQSAAGMPPVDVSGLSSFAGRKSSTFADCFEHMLHLYAM